MIWFTKDRSGGWQQLLDKLSINGLIFRGAFVPEVKAAVKDVINDTYSNCLAEGATLTLPEKPVTFSVLIRILKEKGLIKSPAPPSQAPAPTQSLDPPPPPPCQTLQFPPGPSSSTEADLQADHRRQVHTKSLCKIKNTIY